MSKNGKENSESNPEGVTQPASAGVAALGVQTGEQFANLMSALMCDVVCGRISPDIVNAASNAGGKLLKVVEMQYKYGSNTQQPKREDMPFLLTSHK